MPNPNRSTSEPGGCECMGCGRIFIGGPNHDLCGICETDCMKEEMDRFASNEEMRRDAFGDPH